MDLDLDSFYLDDFGARNTELFPDKRLIVDRVSAMDSDTTGVFFLCIRDFGRRLEFADLQWLWRIFYFAVRYWQAIAFKYWHFNQWTDIPRTSF